MVEIQRADMIDIAAELKVETADAFLLDFGEKQPEWFPKSQVENNMDGTFEMPEWLAQRKGAI